MLIPFNQLSDQQKNVIKNISRDEKRNIFVEGPPGSGKTLISLYTLKDIITESNIKPLLLMYNHSLYGYLKVAIKDIGIADNITIATKDKYFWDLARVSNINIPESLKVYDDKYTYLLQMLDKVDLTATFDVALIDEVQDLNELEWTIIKKISKRIISLGDFDQGIYETGLNYEMVRNNGVYARLSAIFRFHKNIAKLAQIFSRKQENLEEKVTKDSKTQPLIYDVKINEEFDKIIEIIKGVQQNRKTIGIISPDRNKLAEFAVVLESKNIPHFYFTDNKLLRAHDFNDITPLLITSFSAKGLEFENVILFGFDTDSSMIYKLQREKRLNDVIYVSITRTNTNLFIVRTPKTIKEINDIVVETSIDIVNQPNIDDLF
jgi:superfamily I DNA/RNA helicase